MSSRDTSRSDAIVQEYRKTDPKLGRKSYQFSGTWKASPGDVFPLLCPAREADWIPGWTAKVLHSTTGLAEDKCVFETDERCVAGPGLWTFTGFEENESVRFVRFERDMLTHAHIAVNDNGDGTTTATWYLTLTALTQRGSEKLAEVNGEHGAGLVKAIEVYLESGKLAEAHLFDAWRAT